MDLQDLRILRGPKMENRSPFGAKTLLPFPGWDPRNWPFRPNRPGFDLSRGQNSLSQRGNLSWDHRFWPPWGPNQGPDLGSGPPRPSIGGLRPQIWPPRGQIWPPRGQKWPLRDPKSVSQTQKSIQFSSFWEWEKLPSFILDHIIWDLSRSQIFEVDQTSPYPLLETTIPHRSLEGPGGPSKR